MSLDSQQGIEYVINTGEQAAQGLGAMPLQGEEMAAKVTAYAAGQRLTPQHGHPCGT
ncbi:MAG TPA: hypothetical protein VFS96_04745 [Nitrolancea sp.]|nr:hypothetical protein [Nitrolancea sp.]